MWYYILTFIVLLSPNSLRTEAYKAAVIEYFPVSSDTPQDTIRKNLNEYRTFADTAKSKAADIIVFPEYGLTTAVSDPEEYAIEISVSNSIVSELSAIAKERQLYLVVNLLELEKSSQYGRRRYFSTDLVFNRDGLIVASYRKINLYNETKLTPGDRTQSQTFTTDFGVSFGILNSFDIFDNDASRKLFENVNVTDVILLSSWVSQMPFFTSLSVQHGYAVANGINLLAASYGSPNQGRGGSGIYLADGKIAESYIADSSSSKPIIQDVKKIYSRVDTSICPSVNAFGPGDSAKFNVSDYFTKKFFDDSKYKFEPVHLRASTNSTVVCSGNDGFCCSFTINVDTNQSSSDIYKVLAFDGEVTLDQTTQTKAHLRFCSLVACESNSDDTCGARVNTTARFKKITVEGNLPTDSTSFYTPLTLNTSLIPSPDIFFCNNNNGTDTSYVQLTTKKAYDYVLVFGLIGRTNLPVKPRHDDGNPAYPNDPDGCGSEISVVQNSFRFLLFLVLMKYVLL